MPRFFPQSAKSIVAHSWWWLGAVYFLAQIALNLEFFRSLCESQTDYVLISLAVEEAKRGEAFTGAYSRFHFRHPGPILFYFYALGEYLFKFLASPEARHALMQFLINMMLLGWAVVVVNRNVGLRGAAWVAFPLMLLICKAQDGSPFEVLTNVWNPYPAIAACTLFAVASAAVAQGKLHYLFPQILGVLIAGHTHLGTIPALGLVGLWSWVRGLIALKRHEKTHVPWKVLVGCLVLIVIGVLPIAYDALTRPGGGNFGAIYKFISASKVSHSLVEVLGLLSHYVAKLSPVSGDLAKAVAAFLLLVIVAVPRKSSDYVSMLKWVLFLGLAAGVQSLRSVQGEVFAYLVMYQFGFVFVAYVVAGVQLYEWMRARLLLSPQVHLGVGRGVIAALWLLLLPTFVRVTPPRTCGILGEAKLFMQNFHPHHGELYRIRLINERLVHSASTLALRMRRRRFEVCVDDQWWFFFGPTLTCSYKCRGYTERPGGVLRLSRVGDANENDTPPYIDVKKVRLGWSRPRNPCKVGNGSPSREPSPSEALSLQDHGAGGS